MQSWHFSFGKLFPILGLLIGLQTTSLSHAIAQTSDFETTLEIASSGDIAAQYQIGKSFEDRQSYAEAARWYKMAAEQGHMLSQYNLALMYYRGEGVTKSGLEAISWLRRAAEQGYVHAQFDLGLLYNSPDSGIPRNYAEALKWYRKAAEQKHANALNNLGVMYDRGEGVSQNDAEAVKWYQRASEQGSHSSQLSLGTKYAQGKGVPTDFVRAYMWFALAAAQGNDGALRNMTEIMPQFMTTEQINQAQALAAKCFEQGYKNCHNDNSDPVETSENPQTSLSSSMKSVDGESIYVAADPKAKYTVVGEIIQNSNGNLEIVTRRNSSFGESFSKREVNCGNMTFRYLGDGDTFKQMQDSKPSPNMSVLIDGSSSDVISRFACSNSFQRR